LAALVSAQFYDAGAGQQVAMTMNPTSNRWDALDVLRGFTIMLMLLNLGGVVLAIPRTARGVAGFRPLRPRVHLRRAPETVVAWN
jgi:hypothetical protein